MKQRLGGAFGTSDNKIVTSHPAPRFRASENSSRSEQSRAAKQAARRGFRATTLRFWEGNNVPAISERNNVKSPDNF